MNSEIDTGKHYRFIYKGVNLDPARIALIYDLRHPMQHVMLKKILCAGKRGHNDVIDDIKDIICACERWLEMLEEDNDSNNIKTN